MLQNNQGDTLGISSGRMIEVNLKPEVVITEMSNPPVCEGESVTLSAGVTGGAPPITNYSWSNGSSGTNISSINPTPTLINNSYSVTVTDSKGCEGSDDYIVNVSERPTASIDSPGDVCVGNSTVLQGCSGTGLNYSWSPTTWLSNPNVCNPTFTPATSVGSPFPYTLTVTTNEGCTAQANVSVNVVDNPAPSLSDLYEFCLGDTDTNIGGASTGTCSWAPANLFDNPSSCNPRFLTNTAGEGDHTVTLTVMVDDCEGEVETTVRVHPLPSAMASGGEACSGDGLSLNACGSTGTAPLSYSWNPTSGLSDPTGCSPQVTHTTPNTYNYMVTVTDGNGCRASASATATIKPNPNPTVTVNPMEICVGGSATLTASGGGSYAWSTGQTGSSVNVAPGDVGNITYAVTVTGANGCDGVASGTVNVKADPSVDIDRVGTNSTSVCKGDDFTLTATGVSGGVGMPIYSWERDGVLIPGENNPTLNINAGTDLASYDYRVRLSYTGQGCTEAVSPPFPINVVDQPDPILDGPTVICSNQQALYFVTNPDGGSTFEWDAPAEPVVTGTEVFGPFLLVQWGEELNLPSYTISVTESIGTLCFDSDTFSSSVTASTANARPTAPIIHIPVNNILVVKDSAAQCYQWGYFDPVNRVMEDIEGEIYQAYVAGDDYDRFPDRIYWVKTWDGDCSNPGANCATISFRMEEYEGPPPPEERKFVLYPNPNPGSFQLVANRLYQAEYTLLVADTWGRVLEKRTVVPADFEINETIALKEATPNGLYTLILLDRGEVFKVQKFVVQR